VEGRRLGFVVRGEEAYYLSDPSRSWGIALLDVLEEMGFGLDVFLKVHDRASARKAALAVQERFAEPTRHKILGFTSFDGMMARLRESRADAFFSAHVFDWRLTQAGKGRFTLQTFEPGVPGMLRTLSRLADLGDLPFFARYGRFLGRTPEGLRAGSVTAPQRDEVRP